MSFRCPQCGATVDLGSAQIASTCAFCESPLVRADLAEGERPDRVSPFQINRAIAGARLAAYLSTRRWAPESVRKLRPESLQSVFVPFYCYDATSRARYSVQVGLWWYKGKVGAKGQAQTQRVTQWFPLSGSHAAEVRDHLVSGSRGLPEAEANVIEPFDVGLAVPFSPELVAGHIAEHPTVDHATASETARHELVEVEEQAVRRFLPADEVRDLKLEVDSRLGAVKLVLLPIWIGTFRHQGQVLRLVVNGQTGKVGGRVPRSMFKVGLVIGAILLALGALLCGGLILGSLEGGR